MSENNGSGMLQPGQIIKPPLLRRETVEELLKNMYNIDLDSLQELKSYDDRNFLVKGRSTTSQGENGNSENYILKILNLMDSKNSDLIEGQNSMMLFLREKGFNVSFPLKNTSGLYLNQKIFNNAGLCSEDGNQYIVRLMSYISGTIVSETTYTPQILFEMGSLTGKIGVALKDFKNEVVSKRTFVWMLDNVPNLRAFTFAVKQVERLQIINEVLSAWDELVEPCVAILEKGFIHGDLNEQNVLLCPSAADKSKMIVEGVLDFGDVNHSCLLFELAIVIAYMSLDTTQVPVLDVGGHVLAGYFKSRNMPQMEWNVLKECVCARLVQSIVMGIYSHSQDPENTYLLTTPEKGFKALQTIWQCPKDTLLSRWKQIAFDFAPSFYDA